MATKKFNIYIEKPLSNNLKGIKQLKKLQKNLKLKFSRISIRYHPGLILIKKIKKKGLAKYILL